MKPRLDGMARCLTGARSARSGLVVRQRRRAAGRAYRRLRARLLEPPSSSAARLYESWSAGQAVYLCSAATCGERPLRSCGEKAEDPGIVALVLAGEHVHGWGCLADRGLRVRVEVSLMTAHQPVVRYVVRHPCRDHRYRTERLDLRAATYGLHRRLDARLCTMCGYWRQQRHGRRR